MTRDTYLCVFPPINCAGALQVARTIYTINLTICDYASGNDLQSAAGMEERSRRVGVGLCMHLSIVATPDGEVCFTPVFTLRSATPHTHLHSSQGLSLSLLLTEAFLINYSPLAASTTALDLPIACNIFPIFAQFSLGF